ncbi:Crp/Fnr family transcriptional regulator [Micromonospora rifamycinica]|uniref:Crp/Fnr family transcriptional regulator n=1 Tax=Micromonospora rifamycinica TaxID=291594 RepID=UPI002E2CBFD7|nr:Crp/Fnr family transcriptional regulator [Micromonospora rifamycinica]
MIQDRTGRAGTWPTGSFLARLTADDQAVLLAAGAPRSWTPGDLLFRQGDAGTSVVLMLRGYVKVLGRKPDGRPMLLAVRVAGDLIGELAILDGEPRSASVVAAARAAGRVMPAATFRSLLRERPSIADAVHRSVTAKLRMANRHRVDVGGDLVLVRIARLIAHLGEVYGRPVPEGTLIDLPLSHTDLAELVAAAEPSVQRALADLRRLGAVTVGYRKVVIRDRQALSTVAATAA